MGYNSCVGEVSEWFMVPLSKGGLCASAAWVRIPPSPPAFANPPAIVQKERRAGAMAGRPDRPCRGVR